MAFILRRAIMVVSKSRHVQGRASSFRSQCCHVPGNKHPQQHCHMRKALGCRGIFTTHDLLQRNIKTGYHVVKENEKPGVGSHQSGDRPLLSTPPKNKLQFLNYFDKQLCTGEVLTPANAVFCLKCCGVKMNGETASSRNELLAYVWDELEKSGVTLDTSMWNTLLSMYTVNKFDFNPLDFLKDMWQKSNSLPDKTTYRLLVQAYAVQGDPVGAMKMVEFMLQNGDKLAEYVYGYLIQAYGKSGDLAGMEEVLSSMRKKKIQPSYRTYGHLINIYAERGDLESMDSTIHQMIGSNVYLTSKMCIDLLYHLSISGHADLIEKVWPKIEGMEYLIEDFPPLIQQCVTNGDYTAALILLEKTTIAWPSTTKDNYYRHLERRLFRMLITAGKKPSDYITVLSLVETRLGQKQFSRVRNLIQFFVDRDENDTALKFLESLLSENKLLTADVFYPILKSYAEKTLVNDVVKIYDLMIDNGVPVDLNCFKLVILPLLNEETCEVYHDYLELIKEKGRISLPRHIISEIIKLPDITLNQLTNAAYSSKFLLPLKEIKNKILLDFDAVNAVKFVSTLHQRGVSDVTTLIDEIVMHLTTSEENHAEATLIFVRGLIERDVPLGFTVYTEVLKVLYKYGMGREFFLFIGLMEEIGIDPDVDVYYYTLKMAAKVGNSIAAQFCFEKLVKCEDYQDMQVLYEYLVTAYGNDVGDFDEGRPAQIENVLSQNYLKIIDLYDEMITKDFKVSDETIVVVIKAYLSLGDTMGANKVLEKHGEVSSDLMKDTKKLFSKEYEAQKFSTPKKARQKKGMPKKGMPKKGTSNKGPK